MPSTAKLESVPFVSIGMPVYNGEDYIEKALNSLLRQSFKNIELVVSDNASTDRTWSICQEIADRDSRVRLHRNRRNEGGLYNFYRVLELSTGAYFMFAAHDDIWHESFVASSVQALTQDPSLDAWFCTIRNIDSFDRTIRTYDGFSRFSTRAPKWNALLRYLLEPGIMGKPNLIYGVYKRVALDACINSYPLNSKAGSDMVSNFAFLARANVIAVDDVLFSKRIVRSSDCLGSVDPILIRNPYRYAVMKLGFYLEYYRAAQQTEYRFRVLLALVFVFPYMMFRKYVSTQVLKKIINSVLQRTGYMIVRTRQDQQRLEER
jgi:glycosyltransferase involved in cell wall biosynthesis